MTSRVSRVFSRLRRAQQQAPRLIRFLAGYMLLGLALGIAFASLVVLTNTAGLNDLLTGDEHPYIAIFMLNVMCALTFGSLAMGVAVMTLPWG